MQTEDFLPVVKSFNLQGFFEGVYAFDKIPKLLKYRHFLIINTDISKGSGIHWFCCLRSKKDTLEIFDSLGVSDLKKQTLTNCSLFQKYDLECNRTQFQHENSDSCGKMVLYFIIQRMFNLDLSFLDFLEDIFVEDTLKNEVLVNDFLKSF